MSINTQADTKEESAKSPLLDNKSLNLMNDIATKVQEVIISFKYRELSHS